MIRALYCCLLLLHPPAFRRRYAREMLWIFDQRLPVTGPGALVGDAVLSLLRQWFLRSRLWLIAAAAGGALFTVLAGNALLHAMFQRIILRQAESPQELFLFTTVLALLTIALVLIAAVIPVLRERRRRA